jgi:hypothetical protein
MIRAIYREGTIHPLEEVPPEWRDGKELEVHELEDEQIDGSTDDWLARLNALASKIPPDLHDELARALDEIEAESKAFARREMLGDNGAN